MVHIYTRFRFGRRKKLGNLRYGMFNQQFILDILLQTFNFFFLQNAVQYLFLTARQALMRGSKIYVICSYADVYSVHTLSSFALARKASAAVKQDRTCEWAGHMSHASWIVRIAF